MKRKITFLSLALFTGCAVLFNSGNVAVANGGGAPGGNSNSVGDSGNSCGQGGCHGGGHITDATGYFVTDIPGTGYVPGATYSIGVTGPDRGKSKFGFELSAENNVGVTHGILAPSTSGREQLRLNDHITHTTLGTTGASGSFGWQASWTAPSAGAGSVTFSASVLFTNSDALNSGDSTRVSSLTFTEDLTSSIDKIESEIHATYPNPVINSLNVALKSNGKANVVIYSSIGKIVKQESISEASFSIDFSNLKSGLYFMSIEKNGIIHNKTVIKK